MAIDNRYTPPTTQRAYTLRLRPAVSANDSPEERQRKTAEMQSALWATHEAVNRGAKTFGDWLLTLRGGLDHNLATAKVKDKKSERDPTQEEIKNRRILLALSWLSVEDEHGAQDHPEYIVAYGEECRKQQDNQDSRDRKVLAALRDILAARCVPNQEIGSLQELAPGTWLADCKQSLSAVIRPDAVWVNRSKLFDEITDAWNADGSKKRNDAWTLLSFLFKDEFLTIPAQKAAESNGDAESEDESSKRQAAVVASSKGAGQRTRHPFGHLLGQGKPFGKPTRVLNYRDDWHKYLHPLLSGTGIPLVSEAEKKTRKNSQDESYSHTELQREMFSKAASRLAQTITKLRQQEQERQSDNAARDALEAMEASTEYNDALTVLHRYCKEYQGESGSAGEFYLLPRQIAGWDRVIDRWLSIKLTGKDAIIQARIDTVKELQADSEDKKFGDVNLFIRLAEEEYESVWKHKGKVDASVLKIFVEGEAAKRDVLALKVPTYRHPDPYNNPIFCQFGVSRPHIQFRRLMQTADEPTMNDMRAVRMLLWHQQSNHAKRTVMLGMSKRLDYEIGSVPNQTERDDAQPINVPRKGRLGFAAAGRTDTQTPTKVAGIFDVRRIEKRDATDEDDGEAGGEFKQPMWNGTLSADRFQLRRLGRTKSRAKAEEFISKLQWTLTVSIELETRGPWPRYIAQNNKSAFLRTIRKDKPRDTDDLSKGFITTKGEQYIEWSGRPWQELNKPLKENPARTGLVDNAKAARGAKASLMLSRLRSLRLLSVDLGHRFAAAGAVWQTLSLAEFSAEIDSAKSEGARIVGSPQGLYVHVIRAQEKPDKKTKQTKIAPKATIYRRIGADEIIDRSTGELIAHPAPWARLDRQFLIKLQGEERSARRVTPEEEKLVCRIEHDLGRVRDKNYKDDALPKQVDDLQWESVRTARLALRRHGDRARIAFAMTADYKPIPGDRKYFFEHEHREQWDKTYSSVERHQKHIEFLRDALNLWHQLFASASWQDEAAKLLWETHIASLPNYQQPEEIPDDLRGAGRKKMRGENLDRLRPASEALLNDPSLRAKLHELWCQRWEADNGEWKKHLRKLQDWIRPSKSVPRKSIRSVGGLSLQRLATLTELHRKVQAAYFSRLHPDGSKEPLKEQFGQRSLDALERMREQRVKQLASRIVEAALGVGRKQKDEKCRPRIPRDPSCHAIVIESLRHYRPDDLRTRRENRALMDWSSGKVRKYLEESCQLHGLHLREVPPNYTSRQCSRTALPGVRCVECTVEQFRDSVQWKKSVNKAQKRIDKGGKAAEDLLLTDLWTKYGDAVTPTDRKHPIRLPRAGGDLFFAAPAYGVLRNLESHMPCAADDCDLCKSVRGAVQADLNAAANIGLRALLDPDFPGKWWFVPCGAKDGKPVQDQVKGSACFGTLEIELLEIGEKSNEKKKSKDRKDVVYAWRDPSAGGLQSAHSWAGTTEYWNMVKSRAIRALRLYNGLTPKANSMQIA